jgi:hypothetical protein
MDWLVGKPFSISDLQELVHCTLLPSKELQWGLNDLPYLSAWLSGLFG